MKSDLGFGVEQSSAPENNDLLNLPTADRFAGELGFSVNADPSRGEVVRHVCNAIWRKLKQANTLESRIPFYSTIAYTQKKRDVTKVSNSPVAFLRVLVADSYKYFFVFHKQALNGQAASGEIHEEDLSKFNPKHVENGDLFRHLYPRRPVFLDDSWTAVTLFQKSNPGDELDALMKDSVPFAQGVNLDAVLNSFQREGYTQVYHGSRKEVHSLIQGSLTRDIAVAHGRAKNHVGPICSGVIFTAAFGAPAVYLAWHSAMGLASNFGGEVAGAVILGLIALSILVELGVNSRKHACYTQVGNKQYLRSHLGQTLFDIHEGREPTQPDAVQARVIE